MALEQAHRFEPTQRTVERPVRRKKTPIILITKTFGYFVAVEFVGTAAEQIGGAHADSCFKRDQLAGCSSHLAIMSRYMLIVKRMQVSSSIKPGKP